MHVLACFHDSLGRGAGRKVALDCKTGVFVQTLYIDRIAEMVAYLVQLVVHSPLNVDDSKL